MLKFILITNKPALAQQAEASGVERIMVDLEQLGKQERQGHLDTLISSHDVEDVARIRSVLGNAELIVRINPLNDESRQEIDTVIDAGAQILMLPMFRSASEVAEICNMVGGRVPVMPLVETVGAVNNLEEIIEVPGISEIYFGLNDLHLEMNLDFMFEPLAEGMIDRLVEIVKAVRLPFGFGGVARVGEGVIPGELIIAEHARLGSSTVLLSRTFHRGILESSELDFAREIEKLKSAYTSALNRNSQQVDSDRKRMANMVREFVRTKASETAS